MLLAYAKNERDDLSEQQLKTLREYSGLSQVQFARLLNMSVKTLQYWEQARREPTGPAKALLQISEKEPAAALRFLQADSA